MQTIPRPMRLVMRNVFQTTRIQRIPRGMTLVYAIILMTMLSGFVSLGVDYGRVQLAKTQMERAAFAASRAGAAGIGDGTASAKAIQFAAANLVDGTPLVLQAGDV